MAQVSRRLVWLLALFVAGCANGAPAPTASLVPTARPPTAAPPTALPPTSTVAPTASVVPTTTAAPTSTVAATSAPAATSPSTVEWAHSINGRRDPLAALSGVAVESTGNVVMVDTGSSQIQVYDSSGTFVATWGSPGAEQGQFNFAEGAPGSVALDVRGTVFVADSGNARIQKFDRHGVFLAEWGSAGDGPGRFTQPAGVAYDSAHSLVYVLDSAANRLQAFDADGNFVSMLGSAGSGEGQFNSPLGLAVDGAGQIFVADTGNGRVQVFSSDGQYLEQWTSCGQGSAMTPVALAVINGRGHIYVADFDHDRVCAFDTHGQFQFAFGTSGAEPGQFSHPSGVAIADDGSLYVADQGNNRVQKFSPR